MRRACRAPSLPTVLRRLVRSPKRSPRSSPRLPRTFRSKSASRALAADSSASAMARPMCRMLLARSRTKKQPIARRMASTTTSSKLPTTVLRSWSIRRTTSSTCLTVDQLKMMWQPENPATNWNQIDPSFPDQPISLYGPGTSSGTFDYFTGEIVGEEGSSTTELPAERRRQSARRRRCRRCECAWLLRSRVLRAESGPAEAGRCRQRQRLRRAVHRHRARSDLRAAVPPAVRLRQCREPAAPRGSGVHEVLPRVRASTWSPMSAMSIRRPTSTSSDQAKLAGRHRWHRHSRFGRGRGDSGQLAIRSSTIRAAPICGAARHVRAEVQV